MIATNYRYKLNYICVRNIICSNPYDSTKSEGKDLLLVAVKKSLDNIGKLSEACGRLNHTIQVSVDNLKYNTETLFLLLEPVNPECPVKYQEYTTTKPWANPQSSGMKRTKRK